MGSCVCFIILASFELPESVLVRELVYAFQGIEGTYIKFDKLKEGYRIAPEVSILQTLCNCRVHTKVTYCLCLSIPFVNTDLKLKLI